MARAKASITMSQRRMLAKLYLHHEPTADIWYRAGDAGDLSSQSERPTLASLYYRGMVERRVRGGSVSSPAHEYRLTPRMHAACAAADARAKARVRA